MLKKFISYYKPHKKMFFLDLLAAFFISICDLFYPILTRSILYDFIPNRKLKTIFLFLFILALIYIFKMLSNYFVGYYGHIVGVKIQADMRRDLFKHIQNMPISYFDKNQTGDIMSRIVNDLIDISELAHHGPEDVFISGVLVLGSFFYLINLNPLLTCIVFFFIPILALLTIFLRKRMMRAFAETRTTVGAINANLSNSISGIRVSKSFNNSKFEFKKFEEGNSKYIIARKAAYFWLAVFQGGVYYIIDTLYLVMLLSGTLFTYYEKITVVDFVTYMLFVNLLITPVKRLINSVEQFQNGMSGFRRFYEIITVPQEEEGKIEVASITKFDIGKSSTYIYTEKGAAVNNANLSLSDYSIGMYTKEGTIKNKANVTVGKSLVQSGKDPMVSVGMAVEKGTIENYGTIDVPNKHGVGMVANNGGTAINRAGATINANGELSYGMQATESSTLINEGTINVGGKDARGMAATNNSKIKNTGIINVSGEKAQGVFVDFGSEIDNIGGTINVNSSTGTGILAGTGGVIKNNNKGTINLNVSGAQASREEGSSKLEAGDITIKGPKAYIDNVEIQNSGTININGPLDLGTIKLGSAAGHVGTINAESFNKGKFMVLPNATLGSNKDMYTIQYLGGIQNVPNNGSITAISYSATFVADIQKDPVHHNITRIVLVRIPYTKLLAGTDAAEFGKGLDDLYKGLSNKGPQDPEQKIFDALKMISNKDQLGATFDRELRGNTYANVQRRMLDINETFSNSYENLKNSNLYARGRFKTGAIITSGDAKDKNPAVENYKTKTTGLIVMKEKDFNTYGRSADISLAFTETNFKFDYGSKEKVHSLQVGVGFENFITDKNWKYSTRGEFTVNRHNMKRKIHLSNGVYENKGKYWSETVEWKNKLRYEFGTSGGLVTAGAFGTFSLGYGKFNNIKENGDGAELEIKSNNMYMVRPGVGVDLGLNYYTKGGKVSLVGIATAEYETGKVYDGVNQARIKKSKAGYYDLEKPKEIKDIYKVGAQVQYETNAGHKIGVGVVREAGSVNATKYGINAVYKF